MAKVAAIVLFKGKGATPELVDEARSDPKGGFLGDWHGERDDRQILVVDQAVLDDLGFQPGALREQITIEGLDGLQSLGRGTLLEIGASRLEVTQECHGCLTIGAYNGADDVEAFRESLKGRRGIFLRFTPDSPSDSIAVGEEVTVLEGARAAT